MTCICDEVKEEKEIVISAQIGSYTYMSMCYDEIEKDYSLLACGDDMTWANINYCPFCGKKLKEEKE